MDKQNIFDMNSIYTPKFDILSSLNITGEAAMPDYYAPIRKVVSVLSAALPDSKFISGDSLEYGGTVSFTVIYIGEDGALSAFPYTLEYSGRESLPEPSAGTGNIMIEATLTDEGVRVTAPRKLSFKARVRTRLFEAKDSPYSVSLLSPSGEALSSQMKHTVEYLRKTYPTAKTGFSQITETVSGEQEPSEKLRPISVSGALEIKSTKAISNAINVKGDIIVSCFGMTEGGHYRTEKAKLPFEENIICEGALPTDMTRAWGSAASVSVREKEEGGLEYSAEYDLFAQWAREGDISVTTDAFSTKYSSAAERGNYSSLSLLSCSSSNMTVTSKAKRKAGGMAGEKLIYCAANARLDKAENIGDKAVYSGNLHISAVISGDGEAYSEEINEAFKFEALSNESTLPGDILFFSDVSVTDISCRLEDGEIFSVAELYISALAMKKTELCPITRLTLDESTPIECAEAEIKVYYPRGDETLWDIAKGYCAEIGRNEKANGMSASDKADGKPIIIIK